MPDGLVPKISIVTPSFNQGAYLEAAIRSVLDQGYPNLEYIVIDGGSSDDSVAIIERYEQHLAYWCSEPDDGHYAAVNKGFEHASGEIFAWLNSDDMYCPWALKTVGSVFSQLPEVHWLSTLFPLIWDCEGFCHEAGKVQGYAKGAFMNGVYLPWEGPWTIQQESTFWRSSLWEAAGGLDLDFSLAGDFDLWARFFKQADLYGINSALGGFRRHGNQRSDEQALYRQEARQSLMRVREELDWHERLHSPYKKKDDYSNSIIRTLALVSHRLKSRKYMGLQITREMGKSGSRWVVENTPMYR